MRECEKMSLLIKQKNIISKILNYIQNFEKIFLIRVFLDKNKIKLILGVKKDKHHDKIFQMIKITISNNPVFYKIILIRNQNSGKYENIKPIYSLKVCNNEMEGIIKDLKNVIEIKENFLIQTKYPLK